MQKHNLFTANAEQAAKLELKGNKLKEDEEFRSTSSTRRRPSLPKRQLSRTDSTMVHISGQTNDHLPNTVTNISELLEKMGTEGSTTCTYRRRESSKKKLSRTDSTFMVVSSRPERLNFKNNSLLINDEDDNLLRDFDPDYCQISNAVSNNSLVHNVETNTLDTPKSPPILVSQYFDTEIPVRQDLQNRKVDINADMDNSDIAWFKADQLPNICNSTSCPNLQKNFKYCADQLIKRRLRGTLSSDARLGTGCLKSNTSSPDRLPSPQLLNVPNRFTTTASNSNNIFSSVGSNFRHSAPDLLSGQSMDGHKTQKLEKCNTEKCLSQSAIPANSASPSTSTILSRRVKLTLSDTQIRMFQSKSTTQTEPLPSYKPLIGQIIEGLYLGNIEGAYSQQLLCRNKIGNIVDVSGCPPDSVPSHKRSSVPCTCPKHHFRPTLRLCLAECMPDELEEDILKVTKFIEGARNNDKYVLVHCYYGNEWGALSVMYYLMQYKRMNLRKSYSMVMIQRSDLDFTRQQKQFLQNAEKRFLPTQDQSLCFEEHSVNSLLPKEAWPQTPKE